MYLKSVDIVGFKSFADKTRLELKPGIVGVVGPNGCGKSNVMESIRWCIGEMSWKALRSPSMVQVIFAGTSRRPAQNMAEVTLTFDNANALLPVEYSEVTVSRRIFRSGESEYYLNKTQCRLRDIRELFLDTGIGGEGYAIIDQGNVDFVLSAKPEERRNLFEEAAGVAKYKAKREEALRKLERVEQDMARLNDNLVLIQDGINKLENEAKKARLFEKYKQELALQEAVGFVREIEQLRTDVASIDERLEPVKREAADAEVEIDRREADLATINLSRADKEAEAAKVNEELSVLKLEATRIEERIKHAHIRRDDLFKRVEVLEQELAADAQRLEQLEPTRVQFEAQKSQAGEQRAALQAQLDAMRERLSTADADLEAAQARVDAAEAEVRDAAEDRQSLSVEVNRAESGFQNLQRQVYAALHDLGKTELRLAADQEGLDGLRADSERRQAALAEARAARETAEAVRRELNEKLRSVDSQNVELKTRLAELNGRLEAMRAQQQEDPAYAAAQTVLKAGLPGVLGQVRTLLDVEEGAVACAEEALGGLLNALVCEDLASAEAGIAVLKEQAKGRARFVVLSALPDAPQAPMALPAGAKSLLASVRADARAERLARALLADVYMQGSTLHGPHWVSGGSDEALVSQGWLGEGELVAKQGELSAMGRLLQEDREKLRADLAAAESAVSDASRALSEAESSAREAQLALGQRERNVELHAVDVENVHGQSVRLLGEIAAHLERRGELKGRAEALVAKEAELLAKLAELKAARDKVKLDADRAQGEFSAVESNVRHVDEQVKYFASQLRHLQEQRVQTEQARERRGREKTEALELSRQLETQIAADDARLLELGSRLADQERSARELFDALAAARAEVDAKTKELSLLHGRLEELRQMVHQIELEGSGLKTRLEVAGQRLFEQCGLTYDEAKPKYEGQAFDAEKREWLRQRIAKLGNVNMTAPEEMEEHRKRHEFLNTQLQDLAKAKEDLRAAVGKINANTRENFRHTFELVQGHFRRIYGMLFEGGEADLVLTDPENLLETGVEIVAQPPGKKLQSISQLSGGEKALTALALLFAFFSVRPSPFCMLDEADAALDDANVVRFVRLIKDFADKCQFIVISHNKRTMECADLIYGVTMEESGVSTLISVEMTKRQTTPAKDAKEAKQAEPEGDAQAAAA